MNEAMKRMTEYVMEQNYENDEPSGAIDVRGGICGAPLLFGSCPTHGNRLGG